MGTYLATGTTGKIHLLDSPDLTDRLWIVAWCGARVFNLVLTDGKPTALDPSELERFPGAYRYCGSCTGIFRRGVRPRLNQS